MRLENNNLNFYTTKIYSNPNPINGIQIFDDVFVLDIENVTIPTNSQYFQKYYNNSVSAWCISANNPTGSTKYIDFYYNSAPFEGACLSLYANYKVTSGQAAGISVSNRYYTTSSTYHGYINTSATNFTTFCNNQLVPILPNTQYGYVSLGILSGSSGVFKTIKLKMIQPQNLFVPDNTLTPTKNYLNIPMRGGNGYNIYAYYDINKNQIKTIKDNYGLNLFRWELIDDTYDPISSKFSDSDFVQALKWVDMKIEQTKLFLTYCQQNCIKVIIDMHNSYGAQTVDGGRAYLYDADIREKNFEMWRRIVSAVNGHPAIYAYGLINEPNNNFASVITNEETRYTMSVQEYQVQLMDEITKIDPNAKFMVTCTYFSKAEAFTSMKPLKNKNVIYEFHNYFTGDYSVTSTSSNYYPGYYDSKYGVVVDKQSLREHLKPIRDFQLAYNVPIYVGEFGVVRWAQNAHQWIQDNIDIFEEYGWDYTYFDLISRNNSFSPETASSATHNNVWGDALSTPYDTIRPTSRELVLKTILSACQNPYTSAEMVPMAPTNLILSQNSTNKIVVSFVEPGQPYGSGYEISTRHGIDEFTMAYTSANSFKTSAIAYANLDVKVGIRNSFGYAYSETSAIPKIVYPYDKISETPIRAYSTRLITSAYYGPLIRVRRGDLSELDISATSQGIIDTDVLLSFAGTSATIMTWYDQSGNGRHITNPTATRWATIVSAGQVIMNGNLPGGYFNGTQTYYYDNIPLITNTSATGFAVLRSVGNMSNASVVFAETSATGTQYYRPMCVGSNLTGLKSMIYDDSSTALITNTNTSGLSAFDGNTNVLVVIDYKNRMEHRINSNESKKTVQNYNISKTGRTITTTHFSFGAKYGSSPTGFLRAVISELVVYDKAISNPEVITTETNCVESYRE